MKTILFALTVLVSKNIAFAKPSAVLDISDLANKTIKSLNETREIIKDRGYCDENEGKIECIWDIEDTGRSPDTMHGIFIKKDGELILIDAYEEYGC
jgi:hypothetical protein